MYRPTDSFTNDRRVCLLSTEMQPESGLSLLDGPFLCVASLSLSLVERRARVLFLRRGTSERKCVNLEKDLSGITGITSA